MKEEDVDFFITVNAQLFDMHKEISEMSKKKPDNAINKFKLTYINKIVENANKILGENFKPFNDFELFDEDDLPTNSDITIMLSQYQNAMEKFRCNNIMEGYGRNWVWVVDGKVSDIETASPSTKYKYR
ncbi:hypothetical protein [Methanosarcina vacuolata]|uniref:Uncharacterized protein n=1 Tax=Methanosarcina vacuolata Z-761 TaxID=1434123 RepID=A0A0E3Q6L3_9EURY|nr:hypothetical protein [Methanosarcina vacuolata]AKB44463.1 hypothetical protein MSVAZ_2194 [Methanosarcina vacuolata Z-761]